MSVGLHLGFSGRNGHCQETVPLDFPSLARHDGVVTFDQLGADIRRARELKGWTQDDLAEKVGVNRKTVNNWETDKTSPRNAIARLEVALEVVLRDSRANRETVSGASASAAAHVRSSMAGRERQRGGSDAVGWLAVTVDAGEVWGVGG